jgi:hypothetical protein
MHNLMNTLMGEAERFSKIAQRFTRAVTCPDFGVAYMLWGSDFGNRMRWQKDSEVQLDHHAARRIA